MMVKEIKREFNDIGEKITIEIQLKYEDLEVYNTLLSHFYDIQYNNDTIVYEKNIFPQGAQ